MLRSVLGMMLLVTAVPADAARTAWHERTDPQYTQLSILVCTTHESAQDILETSRNAGVPFTVALYVSTYEKAGYCTRGVLTVPLGRYLECRRTGCSVPIPNEDEFRFGVIFPE